MQPLLCVSLALSCLALADASSVWNNNAFGARQNKGRADTYNLDFVTGMAASRVHTDILWMITSDERDNYLFAVDVNTADEVAWFNVSSVAAYDWEDLTYGPCIDDCQASAGACGPKVTPKRYCIYIGDIGSHYIDGAHNIVYMVREPTDLGPRTAGQIYMAEIAIADRLRFTWSEPDAETLMLAPDGRLFVMSKVDTGRAMIAEVPPAGWGNNTVALDEANSGIMKIYSRHFDPQGGSISPAGNEMILVCEEDVFYYTISDGDYIKAINYQTPQAIRSYVPMYDAEAIDWLANSTGFYTYSLGKNQYIYYYPRADGVVG